MIESRGLHVAFVLVFAIGVSISFSCSRGGKNAAGRISVKAIAGGVSYIRKEDSVLQTQEYYVYERAKVTRGPLYHLLQQDVDSLVIGGNTFYRNGSCYSTIANGAGLILAAAPNQKTAKRSTSLLYDFRVPYGLKTHPAPKEGTGAGELRCEGTVRGEGVRAKVPIILG